jgi:hypothetical protein
LGSGSPGPFGAKLGNNPDEDCEDGEGEDELALDSVSELGVSAIACD